jgi:hypothetical protein
MMENNRYEQLKTEKWISIRQPVPGPLLTVGYLLYHIIVFKNAILNKAKTAAKNVCGEHEAFTKNSS